jgi:hypothetical protein
LVVGTWGPRAFENDSAADWLFQIADAASESEALEVIESTLRAAADPPAGEYLDADVGSCALAAAEIVAGALDRPASGLPEDVTVWLQTHGKAVPASFRPLAEAAVARAAGPDSELAELWAEADYSADQAAEVRSLAERLVGPPT